MPGPLRADTIAALQGDGARLRQTMAKLTGWNSVALPLRLLRDPGVVDHALVHLERASSRPGALPWHVLAEQVHVALDRDRAVPSRRSKWVGMPFMRKCGW